MCICPRYGHNYHQQSVNHNPSTHLVKKGWFCVNLISGKYTLLTLSSGWVSLFLVVCVQKASMCYTLSSLQFCDMLIIMMSFHAPLITHGYSSRPTPLSSAGACILGISHSVAQPFIYFNSVFIFCWGKALCWGIYNTLMCWIGYCHIPWNIDVGDIEA